MVEDRIEMAEENIEIIRTTIEAYNRRDVPAVLERLDPDVELLPIRAVLDGMVYRGHDGFKQFMDDMSEEWEEFHPEPEEFRKLGGDHVMVLGRFCGRTRTSGVEVDSPGIWMCELRDGMIRRVQFYTDAAAAQGGFGQGGGG
jgi:ketosteroid isomerase-like protein